MSLGSHTFQQRGGSVQPSGPLLAVGGTAARKLPAKETVDYVHSLTQTTLLLVGVIVFAIVYRDRPRAALRKLVRRVA